MRIAILCSNINRSVDNRFMQERCGNYTSLHYSTYSTFCIEATVHYIRYSNGQKNWVAFSANESVTNATVYEQNTAL